MRHLTSHLFILALCLCPLLGSGCDRPREDPAASRVGEDCTVHFRHDALGASGSPIAPTWNTFNDTDLIMNGALVRATPEWIVITRGNGDYFISRGVILFLEFKAKK